MADFLRDEPVDLVVIGTNGHSGVPSGLRPSRSNLLMQDAGTMTMFVPAAGGFVSMAHGGFTLRRVPVPMKSQPDPHPAIAYAFRAAVFSTEETVEMDLLHVGEQNHLPDVKLPERDSLRWQMRTCAGNPAGQNLRTAADLDSDPIAMTTDVARGFLGTLRGSVTERMIRDAGGQGIGRACFDVTTRPER